LAARISIPGRNPGRISARFSPGGDISGSQNLARIFRESRHDSRQDPAVNLAVILAGKQFSAAKIPLESKATP